MKTATSVLTRARVGALGGALGGSALAFTLMACYGCPAGECGGAYATGDGGRDLADAKVTVDTGAPGPTSDAGTKSDAAAGDAGAGAADGGDAGDAAP